MGESAVFPPSLSARRPQKTPCSGTLELLIRASPYAGKLVPLSGDFYGAESRAYLPYTTLFPAWEGDC